MAAALSSPSSGEATPATRRTAVLTILGLVVYVAALVAGYFAMPVADLRVATLWQALVLFTLAIGAILVVYLAELRRVRGSDNPFLRAIRLALVFVTTYLVVFSYLYLVMETRNPGELPGLVTHLDGLYFSVTMLTTVGFGDITPVGQLARAVATAQMAFNLGFLGFLVRMAVTTGREEAKRRRAASSAPSDGG